MYFTCLNVQFYCFFQQFPKKCITVIWYDHMSIIYYYYNYKILSKTMKCVAFSINKTVFCYEGLLIFLLNLFLGLIHNAEYFQHKTKATAHFFA